ncbi:THUMP domain-containing class I SAM-dependent RNA methyltransferase [Catalinimonas niigatensis]|uniref:THUMP domain-containing class I SAM-dependent RNA methyltransferase n=1 Tax=Catalinimonas niigatensis TaxID=1397264 RepID=UPI0026662526|nr:class I SAM-dependent RNA methyltransferase [Catalinimonas niigatensis]WPP49936.1 class I SAM-dependent RNA methyltransferase [Catalinimonas niigatensis]
MDEKQTIIITCAPYISPILAEEVKALGYPVKASSILEVTTEGSLTDCMYLNLHLRTAHRVLYRLKGFRSANADQLYHQLKTISWEDYIPADSYFSVNSFVKNPTIRDNRFANLKVKDAIVDYLQDKYGRRPDSGPLQDRIAVFLHWKERDAGIFLDTSGESIARHGYRQVTVEAPMQEALAAAIISATQWQPDLPFVNPMCGSGTLAIEAALIKAHKAPGLIRNNFAFMHLKTFDKSAWEEMLQQAEQELKKTITSFSNQHASIIATDNDPKAIASARQNAVKAGVAGLIRFEVADFKDTALPSPAEDERKGVVVINPPYGERLGEEEQLASLYHEIGDFFKQKCAGYWGYIFTGNLNLSKQVGLRTRRRMEFVNGKIDSRLLEYELYTGKR